MDIYLSSAYLGCVHYYTKLFSGHRIFIDPYENYVKQTYRNRCTIVGANGQMALSFPVEHSSGAKVRVKDVRISQHGNWQHLHWNALVSAYNSSPFFEYYKDDFYRFYHTKYDFLFDFNEQLRLLIFDFLDAGDLNIAYTSEYKADFGTNELDLRNGIEPKKEWGADCSFLPCNYYQVFGEKFGFIANMSIIDLLFNMGNESLLVLSESNRVGEI